MQVLYDTPEGSHAEKVATMGDLKETIQSLAEVPSQAGMDRNEVEEFTLDYGVYSVPMNPTTALLPGSKNSVLMVSLKLMLFSLRLNLYYVDVKIVQCVVLLSFARYRAGMVDPLRTESA